MSCDCFTNYPAIFEISEISALSNFKTFTKCHQNTKLHLLALIGIMPEKEEYRVDCRGAEGNIIKLTGLNKGRMSIAEIKVFGSTLRG